MEAITPLFAGRVGLQVTGNPRSQVTPGYPPDHGSPPSRHTRGQVTPSVLSFPGFAHLKGVDYLWVKLPAFDNCHPISMPAGKMLSEEYCLFSIQFLHAQQEVALSRIVCSC